MAPHEFVRAAKQPERKRLPTDPLGKRKGLKVGGKVVVHCKDSPADGCTVVVKRILRNSYSVDVLWGDKPLTFDGSELEAI